MLVVVVGSERVPLEGAHLLDRLYQSLSLSTQNYLFRLLTSLFLHSLTAYFK
jgi:hypothetical protein